MNVEALSSKRGSDGSYFGINHDEDEDKIESFSELFENFDE